MQIFSFTLRKPCLATDFHNLWKIIQLIGVACTALWHCIAQVTSRLGLHMAWVCRKFQKRPAILETRIFWPGAVCKKPKKAWTKAGWEAAFWLSPFLSSLAVPVGSSLPEWPGWLHAGVPQPGDLVLGRDFTYAGASCLSPASPSMTILGDSFCLIHLMKRATACYLTDKMSELRLKKIKRCGH